MLNSSRLPGTLISQVWETDGAVEDNVRSGSISTGLPRRGMSEVPPSTDVLTIGRQREVCAIS